MNSADGDLRELIGGSEGLSAEWELEAVDADVLNLWNDAEEIVISVLRLPPVKSRLPGLRVGVQHQVDLLICTDSQYDNRRRNGINLDVVDHIDGARWFVEENDIAEFVRSMTQPPDDLDLEEWAHQEWDRLDSKPTKRGEGDVAPTAMLRSLGGNALRNWSLLAAAGFVIGMASLQRFAKGLGAPINDLGLDFRGYAIFAASTLVFPIAMFMVQFLSASLGDFLAGKDPQLNPKRDGFGYSSSRLGVVLMVISTLVAPFFLAWLAFGTQGGPVFLGAVTIATFLSLYLPNLFLDPYKGVWDHYVLGAYSCVLLVSLVATAFASYWWGDLVQDGRYQDSRGPLALEIVVPVARGTVSSGLATGCADRVGQNLFLGDGGAIVVTAWDGFVIAPCDREALGSLLSQQPD